MSSLSLQPYLRSGEQVLWHGRPDPRVWFAPADLKLVPFSIMFCGFTIFWESAIVMSGAPFLMMLWGIPFIVAGVYFAIGRFFYKCYRKKRTVYAITSRRLIVAAPGSLADMPVRNVPAVIRKGPSRHVSVLLGDEPSVNRDFLSRQWPTWFYTNTGMDIFAPGRAWFGFFDVADGDAMLLALDQARSQVRPWFDSEPEPL